MQREVALKVRAHGFISEYEEEHGDLIIKNDDVNTGIQSSAGGKISNIERTGYMFIPGVSNSIAPKH